MKTIRKFALVAAASAAIVAACSDSGRIVGPTAQPYRGAQLNVMGACTTIQNLESLAQLVFGAGSPNVNSVLGKLDNLQKKVAAGNVADAQAQATNIVEFVRDKAAQGTLPGTQEQVTQFISGVLCYAGLSPDTFLILPSDDPQVRLASDGSSGVSLEGNTVNEPTLLTITPLDPNGPSPLITELDQYPSYVSLTASSALTKPAIVAVCPVGLIETSVRARLRLGHQAAGGFEITPAASAAFLPCDPEPASALPTWAKKIVELFVPRPLYAALEAGGVGGSVTEFSPFGAVDTELGFSGGVGGSTTEFLRSQPTNPKTNRDAGAPMESRALVTGDACTEVSATVGTELEPECRPIITITTHNGTVLEGVPVAWAVTQGGGTIAANTLDTETCAAFGETASTATDANGQAGICWIMGPEGGANRASATPSAGGDAPPGVTFSPAALFFNATALKITPTASATGGAFVFDNEAHTGSGTCSNDLTPALSYSSGDAPVAVGTHTLTVTCGEGSNVYNTVTTTAAIVISGAVPTVSVSCPASVVYDGSAQTPCSATATAPGLSTTAALTYADNVNVGTATANAAYPAGGNYLAGTGTATFDITAAATTTTVSCPASVTFNNASQEPCSASVSGPGGLSAAVTPSYSDNVNVGTALVSASYAGGGNYLGSTGSGSFIINPAPTAIAVECSSTTVYDGTVKDPCAASVSGPGLNASVGVTYGPAAPVGAGTYVATAVYAGGGNYAGSTGQASFSIGKRGATATAGDATINFGASVPVIPCTVSGLLSGDAGSVTCSTSVPTITVAGSYPTSPVVSPSNPSNYSVVLVNGTLTVAAYVQQNCFSSPIYSVMPLSKAAQRKGSNLPVKCGLMTPQGAPVTTAKGDLVVVDRGTTGTAAPVVAFSGTNVFKFSTGGNYSYGLDTSPSGFVVGHYYFVTATWNDGSTTTGWFLLK